MNKPLKLSPRIRTVNLCPVCGFSVRLRAGKIPRHDSGRGICSASGTTHPSLQRN